MAIQKSKTVNGVTGNYWVAQNIYISPDYTQARVVMKLYEDAAAFKAGEPAIFSEEFILTQSDNPLQFHHLVALTDAKLVTLSGDLNGGSVV